MNSTKALIIVLGLAGVVVLKNFVAGLTPTSELIGHATEQDFNDQLKKSGTSSVMVDFYADWCGPCKTLTPTLNKLAENFPDELKIIKVNVDEAPKLANFYGVQGIPCVLYFKNGKEIDRHVGLKSYNDYAKWLE